MGSLTGSEYRSLSLAYHTLTNILYEKVQEEVQRRIQELAPGGGYLLGTLQICRLRSVSGKRCGAGVQSGHLYQSGITFDYGLWSTG